MILPKATNFSLYDQDFPGKKESFVIWYMKLNIVKPCKLDGGVEKTILNNCKFKTFFI